MSPRLRNVAGASSRWLTAIPTKVPPATTVASSPRSAFSASASSSERGASHSGSVDNGDRLLEERPGELARAADADPLEHPSRLSLRPVLSGAAARVPTCEHLRIHLEEGERVRRLYEVLVRLTTGLVRGDQALDPGGEPLVRARGSQPLADDPRPPLGVQTAILAPVLG